MDGEPDVTELSPSSASPDAPVECLLGESGQLLNLVSMLVPLLPEDVRQAAVGVHAVEVDPDVDVQFVP